MNTHPSNDSTASRIEESTPTPTSLSLDEAAVRANCAPAYLMEAVHAGALAPQTDGRFEPLALQTWIDQCWLPQQRALQAIVDAIDDMESAARAAKAELAARAENTA
ncbi:MAG: hypothetical protein JWP52_4407 [Rhizobacter sp.]|nr:hypothetical protein [Rhizobacter sp.]